ncbi:12755_t:CDS:2, partial [Gigaspora rosea]
TLEEMTLQNMDIDSQNESEYLPRPGKFEWREISTRNNTKKTEFLKLQNTTIRTESYNENRGVNSMGGVRAPINLRFNSVPPPIEFTPRFSLYDS